MKWIEFEGPSFTMEVPDNWEARTSPQFQVLFVSPDNDLKPPPNLAITIRRMEKGIKIKEIVKHALENQQTGYPEFDLLDEDQGKGQENQGFSRRYQWFHPDQKTRIEQIQTLFLYDQMLYTLTATRPAELKDPGKIDDVIAKCIKSFKVIEGGFSVES